MTSNPLAKIGVTTAVALHYYKRHRDEMFQNYHLALTFESEVSIDSSMTQSNEKWASFPQWGSHFLVEVKGDMAGVEDRYQYIYNRILDLCQLPGLIELDGLYIPPSQDYLFIS